MIEVSNKHVLGRTKLLCDILSTLKVQFPQNAFTLFNRQIDAIDLFKTLLYKLEVVMGTAIPGKIEEVVVGAYISKGFVQMVKEDIEQIVQIAEGTIEILQDLSNYKNPLIWHSRPSPDKQLVSNLFAVIAAIEQFEVKPLTSWLGWAIFFSSSE